ncbi:hypothetical protein L210DRAFT_914415 [Boletus edulis BED1]|uniref:Pyridoxamine 5'-phosphate oxidase Alr4036 family FMN-binding domain-containing protein n=1 Tax=Boletus edulis BED1 TaxID=1328754 RepID=A0AAD4GCQ9_BOLED|nr:hypothetical protein L210DRAFT_914415 [Boletus edulis BED1]
MARKAWHEALASALQKEDQAVMQFATLEAPSTPRVRSLIHRGFITASTLPNPPTHPHHDRRPNAQSHTTRDQQRHRGGVLDPKHPRAVPSPRTGIDRTCAGVLEALPRTERRGLRRTPQKRDFDWEEKRVAVFDAMSGSMKATWCRPVPGTPLGENGEEEMKKWPKRLPKVGEAGSDAEKRLLGVALGNFALLMVEPFEVDYVELGVVPNRRTRCEREEGSVEFKETSVVP